MDEIIRFDSVGQYHTFNQQETLHPLVGVIDLSKASPRYKSNMYMGIYAVLLKEVKCGDLYYGKELYDYQEGTLIFLSPGQVVKVDNDGELYHPKGYALVFHPDLLFGTSLNQSIHNYNFFSYQTREALHISEREKQIVLDCFAKIQYELNHGIDKHSKKLIAANIELFLDYCTRFYDRQFITRDKVHQGVVANFEAILNGYFRSDNPKLHGLPSVNYCANELNLSPKYFGDLVKRETGQSAQDYIQNKIIEVAKMKVCQNDLSISELAFDLGFKYPQHFSRLFKQRVGQTPKEFRALAQAS